MKRKLFSTLLAVVLSAGMLSSCGTAATETPTEQPAESAAPATPAEEPAAPADEPAAPAEESAAPADEPAAASSAFSEYGLDENLRFTETRNITVEIYDRANDGGTPPDTNFYAEYIKSGILEKHNIAVEFVRVPRFPEHTELANLLAAGTAPDVSVTYQYPTIQTYGEMGGVVDMNPYLTEHADWFPNLFDLLGDANVYYDKDPVDGHVWAVEALLQDNWGVNTFVRKDWLDALGLAEPTTLQEFEDMLVAFKDNADTLLGEDAGRVIPFAHSHDVRWAYRPLLDSFMPDDLTDKDRYTYGFVEGWATHPAAKEAAKVLNRWYNMDLTWKDFPMYNDNTLGTVLDDLIKAGYVGSYTGNVDLPYRNGDDSIMNHLSRNVGPEAQFVSVNPFPNAAGNIAKLASSPVDRKVFLPSTNDEVMASLLYMDYISSLEVRKFLQIGEEGVTHTVEPDGAVSVIQVNGEKIMNSLRNIDYTITINGLDLGDANLNALSIAVGYPGTPSDIVVDSINDYVDYSRVGKSVNVGTIASESGIVEDLNNKRNEMFVRSITAATDAFDATFDTGVQDIMGSGGQAIYDERVQKWEQYYGDALFLE